VLAILHNIKFVFYEISRLVMPTDLKDWQSTTGCIMKPGLFPEITMLIIACRLLAAISDDLVLRHPTYAADVPNVLLQLATYSNPDRSGFTARCKVSGCFMSLKLTDGFLVQ